MNKNTDKRFNIFSDIAITDAQKIRIDCITKISNLLFNIHKKRLVLNLSTADIAAKCEIPEETYVKIENVEILPKIDTVLKICYILNIDLIAKYNYKS